MEKGQSMSKRAQRKRALREKKKKSAEKESTEGASAPSSFPPILAGGGSDQYDVFLSFRGSDTRKGFTDHLYRSLVNAGTLPISVFRDDNSLEIGEDFNSEILEAITRSKILIPIISENYAWSIWCLRELVRMMDCKKSMSRMVLPIFYKVYPSDVRFLKGNFGEAFRLRENRFDKKDIQEGKQALAEVSYLNGWESEKFANGREGELVEEVIKTILSKLRHDFQLDVPKHLVGVDDHVNIIRNWVDTPAIHARMIGIYGMGGIGKTTLAKVIYNELSNDFVYRSFLPDIRETAHRNGIPHLQNLLIKEIQPIEHQVCKVDDGINLIKFRFKGKKVLILLDDVDNQDQLNALARERDWFMTGSIIIVTTRYKAILDQSEFQVDYKHELDELDEEHSLLLFKRHAFRMGCCSRQFEGISRDILSTMGGLPLAIKVIGSYLYGKTDEKVWQDSLKKLRGEPNRDVQKTLMISFDALEPRHKEIFLDIACFFINENSKFATYMWEDCEFYPNQGIEELKLRCLVKIGDHGEFRMHDQLRDLGRSIFCQGQLTKRYLKLFADEQAFSERMRHERFILPREIYGVHPWPRDYKPSAYTSELFKNLPSPRFLQLCWTALSGDFNELFSELRWLRWFYTEPNLSFPAINLHLSKLVVLELSHNQLTDDWGGWSSIMAAKWLKILNLSCSNNLICTPDLSAFKELEILILEDCPLLEQVHPSIGKVKSLVSLDLSDCDNLKELPTEVGKLKKLQELSAYNCRSLREIPNSIGNLSSLQRLNLGGCDSLIGIPSSIGNLSSLQYLDLRKCRSLREIPSSIGDLQNLQHLDLSHSRIEKLPNAIGRLKNLRSLSLIGCDSLKGEIPSEIGNLSWLEILEISEASISDLPESIQNLSSLQSLDVWQCKGLRSLPELPSGLLKLRACCSSLRLPQLSCLIHLKELHVFNPLLAYMPELPSRIMALNLESCHKLIFTKLDGFKYLEKIVIKECTSIKRLILSELQCLKQLEVDSCNKLVKIEGLDKLKLLEVLQIYNCESIERLPDLPCFALKDLEISDCCNLRGFESLERLLSCRSIGIRRCQFLEKLPNLSKFKNLEKFTLEESLGVTEIPGIEKSRSVIHFNITRCESIQILPDLSGCEKLRSLVVRGCKNLTQLRGLEKLELVYLDIFGCHSLERLPNLPATTVIDWVMWFNEIAGETIC